MTPASTLPETTRIGRTALSVTDLEEMVAFYRSVVGLSVRSRDETTATLAAGDTPVLVLLRDEEAAPRRAAEAGLFHNAFRVPSRTALGAALERVRDDWELDGASDHHVSEALYLADPEDNGVEIYADRPPEQWPRAEDGRVQMGTVPLDLADVAAQSDGAADAPDGTTVGHVHLETTSVSEAREFYVETLGLTVRQEWREALFLAAGEYHHHLGLNAWRHRSAPTTGRGLAWFEFVLPDEAALAAVERRLADADAPLTDRDGRLEVVAPDDVLIRLRTE